MRMHVVIPNEVVHEIDSLVGRRGRSAFLVKIARQEVQRQRLLQFLEETGPVWQAEDHPELEGGAAKWVAAKRREENKRSAARARRKA